MSKISDLVYNHIIPYADSLGLEIVEVEFLKKHDGMHLTVFIDKESGVSINDCEALHRAIDKPLDELDPIDGSYILNVSSLGLDRPLKTNRDFQRNLNKKIKVKLYQAIEKKKEFVGMLVKFDDSTFSIIEEKAGVEIAFEKVKTAHIEPVIEF